MCHDKHGGPRTTTDTNLDCVFVTKYRFSLIPDCKKPIQLIELVTRPALQLLAFAAVEAVLHGIAGP